MAALSAVTLVGSGGVVSAGLLDPVTGPGIVEDLAVDVEALVPDVYANFDVPEEVVADAPFVVTVTDEGLVANVFGATVTGTVPANLELVPDFTDCAVSGSTFTCDVPAASLGETFDVYARTSVPGSYEVCATVTLDAAEGLVEYDDNNTDCATVNVINTSDRGFAALEPGECLTVDHTPEADAATTCNEADHPVIAITDRIDDPSVYTCNGGTCFATNGWRTGNLLAAGYSTQADEFVLRHTMSFGVDPTPCQGIGKGSSCAALVHGDSSTDFDLEDTPWCYDEAGQFTAAALAEVACIVDVYKVSVGGAQIRTWEILSKITEDPPVLPLNILSGK